MRDALEIVAGRKAERRHMKNKRAVKINSGDIVLLVMFIVIIVIAVLDLMN